LWAAFSHDSRARSNDKHAATTSTQQAVNYAAADGAGLLAGK
jgi:hypothetical protein